MPTLQGGTNIYDFAKFCEKLHEIEKILGRRGIRARALPKSATDLHKFEFSHNTQISNVCILVLL